MDKKLQTFRYLLADILAAAFCYTLFYIFRKTVIEPQTFGYRIPVEFSNHFYLGVVLIPLFWIGIYYITGYYNEVFRKSRFAEFLGTFTSVLAGLIIIFFALLINDTVRSYRDYYLLFAAYFCLQFIFTWLPRRFITGRTIRKIHQGRLTFNTLIIGTDRRAMDCYEEMVSMKKPAGNRFVGCIVLRENEQGCLVNLLPCLGTLEDLSRIIKVQRITEVIIAYESNEAGMMEHILSKLYLEDVSIKANAEMDIQSMSKARINSFVGTSLIEISQYVLPDWQMNLKRAFDMLGSIVALLVLSPVCLCLVLGIKLSSKGPVVYSHERIGRFGKPFRIYKFRSMIADAEQNGPELSSRNDQRITRIGRFMRQHRLDEIPNFVNVLKGEMSIVGPRPERKFFIDQIIVKAPHYTHLQRIKPGITSLGQVKFGYAGNVEEMILRLRYDIIYLENMSLFTDLKIIGYTLVTIFRGKGV